MRSPGSNCRPGGSAITVGDIFRVRGGDPQYVRIEGGTDRFDQVGQDMADGEIVVEGEVGSQAGRSMAGGRLVINGDAGRWAASGMRGGHIEITGSAGDRLGGPLAGEVAGMRGGRRGCQGRCRRPRRGSFAPRHHHRGRSGRRSRRQLHDRRNFDRAAQRQDRCPAISCVAAPSCWQAGASSFRRHSSIAACTISSPCG